MALEMFRANQSSQFRLLGCHLLLHLRRTTFQNVTKAAQVRCFCQFSAINKALYSCDRHAKIPLTNTDAIQKGSIMTYFSVKLSHTYSNTQFFQNVDGSDLFRKLIDHVRSASTKISFQKN